MTCASYGVETTALSEGQGIVAATDAAVAPVYEEPTALASECGPSYPDLCIPPGTADLNCDYVFSLGMNSITVYAPDPHGVDGDGNGVGCEG